MSKATTSLAPLIAVAMDSIPDPVPISNTLLLEKSFERITLRRSWVVSCRPVPKAPWEIKFILFLPSISSSGEARTQLSSISIAGIH